MSTHATTLGRVFAVLAVAASLHSCGVEYEEIEVEVGYRGEAKRNPYLAAERFTARAGFEVDSRSGLRVPGADVGFVMAPADALLRREEQRDAILRWIEDGGCFVMTIYGMERPASPAWIEFDEHPWLVDFGIELDDGAEALVAEEWGEPVEQSWGRGVFDGLEVGHARTPSFDARRTDSGDDRIGTKSEARAVALRVGAGHLVVLADGSPFWNGALGYEDDAEFLWRSLELAPTRVAWFVHGRDESLVDLLLARAPEFTLAAVLLVVLWLWRLSARFGPRIEEPAPERLAYLDHVRATGRFLRRNAGYASLVQPWRRRALRAAAHGGALAGGDHERASSEHAVAMLAERSGLARERVEHVLFGPIPADSGELVAAIRDLQLCERAR